MNHYYRKAEFDILAHVADEKLAQGRAFCIFYVPKYDDRGFWLLTADSVEDYQYRMLARVRPWQHKEWIDFSSIGSFSGRCMEVCPQSTPRSYYLESISKLTAALAQRGGKTVICRNICGEFERFDLWATVKRYMDITSDNGALMYLFYHPATGFWMGATPELILERTNSGCYHTIALAGTRRAGEKQPWDAKNIEEHTLVADDIERRLRSLGFDFERGAMHELAYGAIEHLCTDFTTQFIEDYTREAFDSVVDALEPTPAVAGYPRAEALAEIEEYELWPRHCYGGCLNIADVRLNMTYGILRCIHFDRKRWSIYTGSGITAKSDPEAEWAETEAKAAPLLKVVGQ